ncbi:methyltransferase domain-containing protein [Agromyces albus]|uniref:methyltransferase domain-containing protein n=1 Tax=Agromyces albus TaxID=205332 RepID=UPI0027D78F67|nr:methyltransferase domain-containing protein [Agromyces albus]
MIGCAHGHRFDLSRHDIATLLPPRAPRTIGDDRPMLEARRRLLESGAYDPVADAIVHSAEHAVADETEPRSADTPERPLRMVDLGCGTGQYAQRLAARFPDSVLLLADRSPDAVRMSVRAIPAASGVVLDLWRPLPIRDAIADIAINVFAPRNPVEFARIVRPGGRLIVVVPTPEHLVELRRLGLVLDVPAGKSERVRAQLEPVGFRLADHSTVEYGISADAETRALLVGMGPSAHHRADSPQLPAGDELAVTVSVEVLSFDRV